MPFDRVAFIKTNTQLALVHLCPEIRLYLANEATELWQKTEDELHILNLPPPFWAFAWAGGQALARYVLDHPETVKAKRVLDLASGSGLVAIAAALAGAAMVEANEVDLFALEAIALNAAENRVAIQPLAGTLIGMDRDEPVRTWDVVLAGDMSYERDMAKQLTDWLRQQADKGAAVLIGDPGRAYLARDQLQSLARYEVPVSKSLEDCEMKLTDVWAFRRGGAAG